MTGSCHERPLWGQFATTLTALSVVPIGIGSGHQLDATFCSFMSTRPRQERTADRLWVCKIPHREKSKVVWLPLDRRTGPANIGLYANSVHQGGVMVDRERGTGGEPPGAYRMARRAGRQRL